jgi:hypothetical protein
MTADPVAPRQLTPPDLEAAVLLTAWAKGSVSVPYRHSGWLVAALAEIPPKRRDEAIYEFACHEGNVSMAGMLRTACLADAVSDGRRPR